MIAFLDAGGWGRISGLEYCITVHVKEIVLLHVYSTITDWLCTKHKKMRSFYDFTVPESDVGRRVGAIFIK
jgi:hypothetical protein